MEERILVIGKTLNHYEIGEQLGTGPRRINIVLNWFEELKQKVPTK